MKTLWSAGLLAVFFQASLWADTPRPGPQSFEVPYRLTVPKHILVRAKLNGKGPFNFILDTGAPALFVSTKICERIGVKPDARGWGTFDRLEIEGGVVLKKARGRIDDPFQLEGMNGLGLAGAELHGVIGYNILARYRMEIDFTRDKMVWSPLDFEPVSPRGMGGKGGSQGGMEVIGTLMKMAGSFLGTKADPEVRLSAYLGVELAEKDDVVRVVAVLADGPAGNSDLQAGDRITKVQERTVISVQDVAHHARKVIPGRPITLTVLRGRQTKEITFKTGEGL